MDFQVGNRRTEHGTVAYVIAASARFSFLVGKRELRVMKAPGAYFWVVERDGRSVMIRFVIEPLPENATKAAPPAEQILASDRAWEIANQVRTSQEKLLKDTLRLGHFPTGELFAVRCSEAQRDNEKMARI